MTEKPDATDWQNRAYRAEAECKELREILTDDLLKEVRFIGDMTKRTPAEVLQHWLELSRTGPKPSEREKAALAILRAKAIEQAVSIAQPGESEWNTKQRADALLAHILGS